MSKDILTLVLGFVLTVLIGGAYASYLQQRSWRHQNQSRLDEEERKQASEVYTSLSELIDRRRYRMQQLLSAIDARREERISDDELKECRSGYEQVLTEWHDQLTTRLVAVGMYFGTGTREYLNLNIGENFVQLDEDIETLYCQIIDGRDAVDTEKLTKTTELVKTLTQNAYNFSFSMMLRIRRGKIGHAAQQPMTTVRRKPTASIRTEQSEL